MAAIEEQLVSAKDNVEYLTSQLQTLAEEKESIKTEVLSKENAVSKLTSAVQEKSAEIKHLLDVSAKYDEIDERCKERQQTIEKLQRTVKKLESEKSEMAD